MFYIEPSNYSFDCLFSLQVAKKQKYRFWSIVEELRNTTNIPYKTILLEFINCIVIYTDKINERVRIRNEFYGKSFRKKYFINVKQALVQRLEVIFHVGSMFINVRSWFVIWSMCMYIILYVGIFLQKF